MVQNISYRLGAAELNDNRPQNTRPTCPPVIIQLSDDHPGAVNHSHALAIIDDL
jgi:hypothetical protein